jgi:hypothetical protein
MHKFVPAALHILQILISEEPEIIKLPYKDIKEHVKKDLEAMAKASFRFDDCVKRILPVCLIFIVVGASLTSQHTGSLCSLHRFSSEGVQGGVQESNRRVLNHQ